MPSTLLSVQLSTGESLQPLYANAVFAVYMYSYILLVCAMILFFSMLHESSLGSLSFKVTLNVISRYRLRWLLLVVFSSMAALPPSFFFFAKLGLLSSVLHFGTWHTAGLFFSYILFSWGVYYSVLRYFLFSIKLASPTTLVRQRLSAKNAVVAIGILCFTLLTVFFFDDIFFCVYWALV